MMGLHRVMYEDWEQELAVIERALNAPLSHSPWVAIGEIGLDLHWDSSTLDIQRLALRIQLQWAKQSNFRRDVRNAFEELFEVLDAEMDDALIGVIHCFTGGLQEAQHALSYPGWMLGIGGVATYKNGGLDAVLPHVPLDRILLETDSPYLAPVPHRGKRNESSYITLVASRVAEIMGKDVHEVARQTTTNAMQLFGLDSIHSKP